MNFGPIESQPESKATSDKFYQTYLIVLTRYWNNIPKKCGGLSSNGFHIKWIIGTHGNWKNQNPGAVLELDSSTNLVYLAQFWGKWAGLAVLFSR